MRTSTGSWDDGFGFYQRNGSVYWWVNAWNATERAEIAATSFGMTHWVGTYDGSNLKLYRNGSLVDTGSSFTANITEPSNGLLIGQGGGNASSNDYYWDGNISIVRIYSTALTAAQINAQFKLGPTSLLTVVEPDAAHFNANNPLSFPGKVSTVDTAEVNLAGGSEIECLKVYNTFTPPSGGTNERPYAPKPGELYYNYDLKTIEFHDGYGWRQVDNTTRSGRGVFAGGFSNPLYHSIISYIQIPTTGNALNFGDLTTNAGFAPAVSNGNRAVWGSRYTGSGNNTMDYVTIPSQGNAIDFGNSTGSLWSRGGFSSSTRGIFFGGNPSSDVIEYIEIATIGDALDFGDIMSSRRDAAGLASATRGILSGGEPGIGANFTRIESITIASKGNSIRFGESTMGSMGMAGASNSTRGIFAGGTTVPTLNGNNTIEFVTISSEGNAVDFGDLTQKTYRFNAMSTGTRVVFAHGTTGPSGSGLLNTMDYINISSQGNATDFGDKIFAYGEYSGSGTSDSHGGLGGF